MRILLDTQVALWSLVDDRRLPSPARQLIADPRTEVYAAATEDLPALHADPFDRLLVAQALAEPLRLITHDRAVAAYSDSVILV